MGVYEYCGGFVDMASGDSFESGFFFPEKANADFLATNAVTLGPCTLDGPRANGLQLGHGASANTSMEKERACKLFQLWALQTQWVFPR